MADLYTYLTFIGIISVWSIYGFVVTFMKSVGGMSIFMYGLCFVVILQFLIGFVHIMLLYSTYRPILMNNCMQRQPYRFFWWSENYEENEQFKGIFDKCTHQWSNFSTERLVSWVVYTVVSGLVLAIVIIHKNHIPTEHQEARGYIVGDQEGEWTSNEKPTNDAALYQEHYPPSYGDEEKEPMDYGMRQQRQKLYDEIEKRQRAKKNFNRKSVISNTSSSEPAAVSVVHPLDLTKGLGAYQIPPVPPNERRELWNRYEGTSIPEEDYRALQHQKRFDSHSSERMEYELYKSNGSEIRRRHSNFMEKRRRASGRRRSRLGSSQRKASTHVRWRNDSKGYAFSPLINNSNDLEEEEHGEEQESANLMKPEDTEPTEQAS
ncbi:hypothetical protein G6F57_008669 [Rhizopus arrhizus]|nr:hypothetical protein G6F24_008536 [Rhizopus arrhizus]KAG1418223.1 hypothetical protein G6F58_005154 [Rhizopus delemar]KAG0935149.1 hypothetical protein G6F30_009468 [Rhizopus arrhizus]KAG0977907.1 hypothetical protein G6F29_009717 [Rhizopus arrhizus]KAG0999284.1 hypothetical protein G6F28_001158 [Rhizopus arrhizus]